VHHNSVLIKVQPDATVCRYLFTAKSLYMFRVSQHPSSGVLKTVTATSGTGHNTGTATSLQPGPNKYLHTLASGWIFINIHKLVNSIWNKGLCRRSGRGRSLYLCISRAIKQIVVIIEAYTFCQLRTKYYPAYCSQHLLHMQRKLLEIISVDFDATSQLLIMYSASVKYLRKNGNTTKQCIRYLWTSRKLMFQLGWRTCIIFSNSLISPGNW